MSGLKRVSFFIDGFNVYHNLKDDSRYHKFLWLDYRKLSEYYIKSDEIIADIFYFTALAKQRGEKVVKRHRDYIAALKFMGVETVLGRFKKKERKCKLCKSWYTGNEEKKTDVNLSLRLFVEAYKNTYDKAFIVTNDTDMVPAVEAVKNEFSDKEIGVLVPFGCKEPTKELKTVCDLQVKIFKKAVRESQLPDVLKVSDKYTVIRPKGYS